MTRIQVLLGLVLAAFGFELAWGIQHFGYVGLLEQTAAGGFPATLMFFELSIGLALITVWMWRDARQRGATLWPYLVLTLALGMVGPLVFLIVRESSQRSEASDRPERLAQPA